LNQLQKTIFVQVSSIYFYLVSGLWPESLDFLRMESSRSEGLWMRKGEISPCDISDPVWPVCVLYGRKKISGPDQQPAKAGLDPLSLFHVLGEFSKKTVAKLYAYGKSKMLIAPICNSDLYRSLVLTMIA
jgi:hypothetical protein